MESLSTSLVEDVSTHIYELFHGKTYDLVKIFDMDFFAQKFHALNDHRLKYWGHVHAIYRDMMS